MKQAPTQDSKEVTPVQENESASIRENEGAAIQENEGTTPAAMTSAQDDKSDIVKDSIQN